MHAFDFVLQRGVDVAESEIPFEDVSQYWPSFPSTAFRTAPNSR